MRVKVICQGELIVEIWHIHSGIINNNPSEIKWISVRGICSSLYIYLATESNVK